MRKKLICGAYKILSFAIHHEYQVICPSDKSNGYLQLVKRVVFKELKKDFTECVHSLALLLQMPTQGNMVCWKAEIGKKIISYALQNRKKKTFSVLVHMS